MKFTLKKKLVAGLAAGALLAGVGGAAFAYWTSTGSGTGTAATTAGSSDLTYSTNSLTAMFPGDAQQTLTVTVTNNNTSQAEFVSGVSAYITTNKVGCTGADFLLDGIAAPSTALTAVPLGWTGQELAASPAAGDHASTSGDTIQFNDTSAVQDACKNAIVTLNYAS